MANLIIVHADFSDNATLTASSEDSSAQVDQLQKMQPSDFWRSQAGDVSGVTIDVDRGSSQPVNFVALLHTNLTTSATWQVQASEDSGFPGNPGDYDSGSVTFVASSSLGADMGDRHGFLLIDTNNLNFRKQGYDLAGGGGLERQHVQLALTDAGNPDNYLRAGRLIVGQAYRPTANHQYGAQPFGVVDPSRLTEHVDGTRSVRARTKRRSQKFTLGFLDETEARRNLYFIQGVLGGSTDVLIILDPDDSTFAEQSMLHGLLSLRQSVNLPSFDTYEQVFEMEGLV